MSDICDNIQIMKYRSRLLKSKPYKGAGILFYTRKPSGSIDILLARRKRSGIWSIPGGGADHGEHDRWQTATRETLEEFGNIPPGCLRSFVVTFPFAFAGFSWKTYVVFLAQDFGGTFPDRQARDFNREFSDARWFPLTELPRKSHLLLWPAVNRLRREGPSVEDLSARSLYEMLFFYLIVNVA
jgi:8-oxo-dGTP pyrophosphatase MutT (NUDIX family)